MVTLLRRIQNELFDCGADLATPLPATPPEYPQLRIDESYLTALESACDEYNADLPILRSFVLPGGTPGAALLHTARAVTGARSGPPGPPSPTTATRSAPGRPGT